MQIVVDQLLTTYQLTGSGKLVIWLHGWGDSSQGSLAMQAELAKTFQVLAIDLPGFGGTQAPAEAWGLSDYADFVQKVIEKLGLKSYVIIGHSNGGAIAIRGLVQGSLRAKKLVLLASAGIRNQYTSRKRSCAWPPKHGKALAKPLPSRTPGQAAH